MDHVLHFSTGKDNWGTPDSVFDPLNEEFGFTLDAAADPTNTKCARWLGPGGVRADALDTLAWPGVVWVNPPYSRGLQARFVAKAVEQAACGSLVVMLLPARTDTKIFHSAIWDRDRCCPRPGVEVRFLKGRIKFQGATAGAPFPSMVVVFWP